MLPLARVMPVSHTDLEKNIYGCTKKVCLSFTGFHTLHLGLGVRCLPLHTLLHYIDSGVLHLTETCVRKLLKGTVSFLCFVYQPANWERCPLSCSNSNTGFTAQETQFFIQSAFSVKAVADDAAQLKGENYGSDYKIEHHCSRHRNVCLGN